MDLLTANDRPGDYPASYYAEAVGPVAARPAAAGALRADVCVIGAGYTGLSAALHLAQAGYDVVVLEASRVGFGASGRNGGQVGTGQRRNQPWLEKTLGTEAARALWALGLEAVAMVRQVCRLGGVPLGEGILHAGESAGEVRALYEEAAHLANVYGYDRTQALDAAACREAVGSRAYVGGVLDRGGCHVNPLEYALALAAQAEAAGARVFEASRVVSVGEGGQTANPAVATEAAEVEAGHVVLACNGYLGDLAPRVAARAMPINNFIGATEVLGREVQDGLIRGGMAVADGRFVVNYFRLWEGRMLFGGGESYGYRFPRDIGAKVRRPMLEIFPQLEGVPFTHAWGGTLAITMSRMPHFARLRGNVLSASGYSGHGVAMASLAGRLIAEAVRGQAERFDLMASVPTPRFPGGRWLRSPLLVAGMLWYSLRDRLG